MNERNYGLNPDSTKQIFNKSRVNIPGLTEVIYQPFYDYQTLLAAGTTSQRFFQIPVGQAGRTFSDTNMELAGQIPKGQAFEITGVQFEIYPVGATAATTINAAVASKFADDVYNVLKGGHLILNIGSKEFIKQGNLFKFPPVNRMWMDSSTTVATDRYVYASGGGRQYQVAPLLLESNQNFGVEIKDIAALPSGNNAKIGVTLNGFLHRNAQ
jgi:hypothetical protein